MGKRSLDGERPASAPIKPTAASTHDQEQRSRIIADYINDLRKLLAMLGHKPGY
jgi:hypothetical protein